MSAIYVPVNVQTGSNTYQVADLTRTLLSSDDGKFYQSSLGGGTFDLLFSKAGIETFIATGKVLRCFFSFEQSIAFRVTVPAGWSYTIGVTSANGPATQTIQPASSGAAWAVTVSKVGAAIYLFVQSTDPTGTTSTAGVSYTSNNKLRINAFTSASANAGGVAPVPASVIGFLAWEIDGALRKIPYFAN